VTTVAAPAPAGIPARLAAVPHRWLGADEVELAEPLPLAGALPGTADAVALLRDCATAALRVRWWTGPEPELDLSLLHHLPPPAGPPPAGPSPAGPSPAGPPPAGQLAAGQLAAGPSPTGPPGAGLDHWRRAYRYGSCHFRRGPGFVQVKDARDPAGPLVVLVADHPDLVATFLRCLDPTPLAALDATGRTAVDLLLAERLVLLAGGAVLTLPHRMRRWPVPYNAV